MPPRARSQPKRRDNADPFGADYYRRFYGDTRTRVSDAAAVRKLAGFVAAYLIYLDVPVRSILDVGCGVGHWRQAAAELWPRARYHGVEYSAHLCERFGWTQGSSHTTLGGAPRTALSSWKSLSCVTSAKPRAAAHRNSSSSNGLPRPLASTCSESGKSSCSGYSA